MVTVDTRTNEVRAIQQSTVECRRTNQRIAKIGAAQISMIETTCLYVGAAELDAAQAASAKVSINEGTAQVGPIKADAALIMVRVFAEEGLGKISLAAIVTLAQLTK